MSSLCQERTHAPRYNAAHVELIFPASMWTEYHVCGANNHDCPPKAEVTRSNRVGCANKSSTYANSWRATDHGVTKESPRSQRQGNWPNAKNARYRVWLNEPAAGADRHLADRSNGDKSNALLLVASLGIERVTPHDLRRTCLTWITRLGFGRDAMDRVANHKTCKVTDVYDPTATATRTGGSWRPSRGTSSASSRGRERATWSA
jgi:hypothetical protein